MFKAKVYINRKPVYKPWGGGIKTVNLLCEMLTKRKIEVVHDLNHEDISLIFIIDPRTSEWGDSYDNIYEYSIKHKIKIIQRVGDLGLHSKPELTELLRKTIPNADCVTYISDFAKNYLKIEHKNDNVINLAPLSDFYKNRNENLELYYPVKIVTHHWSNNPKKGFEYYKNLENVLSMWSGDVEFTFIGNLPEPDYLTNHIEPCGVDELVKILPSHDIYLSASVEETGGNHVLEALGAGLPVLYHTDGGGIVDYCMNAGYHYDSFDDMLHALTDLMGSYEIVKKKVLKYTDTLESVVEKYIELIEKML
jgi:hypothetical protein